VYFRFTAGLLLAVVVSMAGVWLEKQTLELRRDVSVQHYQTDVLIEWIVRKRLEAQARPVPLLPRDPPATKAERGTVAQGTRSRRRTAKAEDTANAGMSGSRGPATPSAVSELPSAVPRLKFQRPFYPEGIQ